MHPSSMQMRPFGHVKPTPHWETQCCSTQTAPPLHDADVVHGPGLPVQTPFAVSHEKPVGQGFAALHVGVHAPCTHCSLFGHCVWSAHWFAGATHEPERHFEPAGVGQSASLLHVEVTPPSPPVPIGTHCGVPPESLQTYCEGQPEVEQSPGWHLLSAPHVEPAGQSDGFVQSVPELSGGGAVPPPVQWWSLVHVYPLGQSPAELHVQEKQESE
jgi:hypothetical protein